MRPVAVPVCPSHPDREVHVRFDGNRPPTWGCEVCRRTLGVATIHTFGVGTYRFPEGRRPRPAEMARNAMDWNWVLSREPDD